MEKRKSTVIDCDVFCLKEFYHEGDIAITGNFYAESVVDIKGALETGEDIIIRSPALFSSYSLRSLGKINIHALAFESSGVFASDSFEFISPDDILYTM